MLVYCTGVAKLYRAVRPVLLFAAHRGEMWGRKAGGIVGIII